MYTGIPPTSNRHSPGSVSCQSFPAHTSSRYVPIRPPDLRACEKAIQLFPHDPQRYPQDIKWPLEYIEASTNSSCSIVIINLNAEDRPIPGREINWPGIHHIAEKIVDECFGQPEQRNDMGYTSVWARQWTHSLDSKITEEAIFVFIALYDLDTDLDWSKMNLSPDLP